MPVVDDDEESGPGPACELCGPPIDVVGRGRITLRHSGAADAEGLRDLYRRLRPQDLRRRFFTGGLPPLGFFEHWAAIEDDGGFGLVAAASDHDDEAGDDDHDETGGAGQRDEILVAEAGYGMVPGGGGDGELGIAIDPDHRGWLGPWLLDRLLAHAHERGVANLQAVILVENRTMLALAARRGYAILGHPDWSTIRITMATSGHVPSWSGDHERPRVLVETDRSRWIGEEALTQAGFDVALCNGPCRSGGYCPILRGEPCPLVAGADAVIVDLADTELAAELLGREQVIHPGVRHVAATDPERVGRPRLTADEVLVQLEDLLPPEPEDV